MRKIIVFLAAFWIIPTIISGTEQSPQALMDEAFKKLTDNEQYKAKNYTFKKEITEEELNKDSTPKPGGKKTKIYAVGFKNGKSEEFLIEVDGQPVLQNQSQQSKNENNQPGIEDILKLGILNIFVSGRYNYEFLIGPEENNEIIVIKFTPRDSSLQPKPPNNNNIRTRVTNKILNGLRGLVYINPSTHDIIRVETGLVKEPLRHIEGVGVAYWFDVILERQKNPDEDITLTKSFILRTKYSYFFGLIQNYNKRIIINYTDYAIIP